MKKIIYVLSLTLLASVFFGCDVLEPSQDAEPISDAAANYPTPTFTLTSSANLSALNEGDENVLVWDVTVDKPIDRNLNFSWVVLGGTATLHEDYDLVNATIPAYETTGQLMIMIHNDSAVEGAETLQLTVESGPSLASKYLVNPSSSYPTASLTINNFESDDLEMSFDWEKGIDFAGSTYGTCANIDLDIFVSNAAGFDINDPWATFNGTNYAATGDCPETFDWIMSDWGDGDYVIWHEVWSNGFAGLGTNTLVPITASISRAGVFSTTVVQADVQAMNSDNGGEADDLPVDTHGVIAQVSVANGIYTISDYNGNVVATGKTNTAKTKRPSIDKVERAIKTLH
ncbi:MAG: hypothetical protein HKO01_12490 [Flaviramulus sp.]|nr:hypothetical protein [Flaviramulus sp.]NNC51339.1 hypothetical protein [Flaviramulus sp.]